MEILLLLNKLLFYSLMGILGYQGLSLVGELSLSKQTLEDYLKHIYIIGQTGAGKTTFIINKVLEFMDYGTVIFISYKDQKTSNELLESIPDKHKDDVIYIDPTHPSIKIGFSMFGKEKSDFKNILYVDSMINIYKAIWGDAIGASSEDIFRMIGLGVAEMDIRTPIEIYNCLNEDNWEYRKQILEKTSNPIVKDFFTWDLPKKLKNQNSISPPRNKQRKIVSNPIIRYTLCQSNPKLNLEKEISRKRLIIANFNQEKLGPETAPFLASMFLSQVQIIGFTRKDKSVPIFIVADEFQDYVNSSFEKILSQARSFNISFTLAHQYMKQIPEFLINAIDGNVANKYYFRTGLKDARYLERFIEPFTADDLVNLPNYTYLVEKIAKGKKQSIKREKAPRPPKKYNNAKYIKKRSLELYGVPKKIIDRDINIRLGIKGNNNTKIEREVEW
ncbi:MAG: hypothetical protein H0Z24_06900 [Thermosipho sp. (in: Bacteria)]|nr:hypothetical protein [Thermosipho sp. (in: thermotogales)]